MQSGKILPPVANEIIGDRLALVDSLADSASKGCAVVELRDHQYVIHLDEPKLLAPADKSVALWELACQLAIVFLGCLRLDDEDAACSHAGWRRQNLGVLSRPTRRMRTCGVIFCSSSGFWSHPAEMLEGCGRCGAGWPPGFSWAPLIDGPPVHSGAGPWHRHSPQHVRDNHGDHVGAIVTRLRAIVLGRQPRLRDAASTLVCVSAETLAPGVNTRETAAGTVRRTRHSALRDT